MPLNLLCRDILRRQLSHISEHCRSDQLCVIYYSGQLTCIPLRLILRVYIGGVCWGLSWLSLGKSRVTTWTSQQFTAGPHRKTNSQHIAILTHTHTEYRQFRVPNSRHVLNFGGKRRTQREPTQPQEKHVNVSQKGSRPWRSHPKPSCCQATEVTSATLSLPLADMTSKNKP